jgi:dipeptidyl aminopeptidase/acylaminoacyl peptidase
MRRVLSLLAVVAAAGLPPARADLPPLIPRQALFANPERTAPQLSPDGGRLGYVAPSDKGVANVWVEDVGGGKRRMVTQDARRGIYAFQWAPDGRHVLYQQDRDGDENWHLYAADLDTGLVRDLTPFLGIRVQNVLTDYRHPTQVLAGLNVRDRRVFDMYRIDLTTGAVTPDTRNPGDVLSWVTDGDFVIRAATTFGGEDCKTSVRVRADAHAPWQDVLVSAFEDSPFYGQVGGGSLVAGFTPDGKSLYVVSPLGGDRTRLVRLDARTGKELEVLADDPRSDVEFFIGQGLAAMTPAVVSDPRDGHVQAVGFNYTKLEWKVLDPAVADDFRALAKVRPGEFLLVSRDHKDTKWVVRYTADSLPDAHYLYDRATRTARLLFKDQPALDRCTLAETRPVVVKARDGLELVCYLTLPPGMEARKLPLVVFPHGGPWWRDRWGFDPVNQLLANRGYAVLQVNFRCSTGFGKKFLNAGNLQFGPGAVLRDLGDALAWAVAEGIADPRRVAVMGGSFGGYATLTEIALHPERYACAVDLVGPSNLRTLFQSMPDYWRPVKERWARRMGDVEHDDALNERLSPLFHAGAIRAPLLIAHGANDPRVKLSESERIVKELRGRGRPVTFVVYPDEGHGFARPENNLDFFGRVEEFLAKHLGGRAEPWQKVSGSTAEVR